MIFRERGSNTQRAVADGLRQNGFLKSPAFVLSSREAIITAVAMNLGVGFAYDREISGDSRVVALPVAKLQSVNLDQVVWLKARTNTRPKFRHVAEFVACADSLATQI